MRRLPAILALSLVLAACSASPAPEAKPSPVVQTAPKPLPPVNLLVGTTALEPLEALRGVHTDIVRISPDSITASVQPLGSAVYLADEGVWYDLPQEETFGWLIHDLDLTLIPEVFTAAPSPCTAPIVALRIEVSTFGFMVECGPAEARTAYYFNADGTPVPALDLTTAAGLQAALNDVVAETEGTAELVLVTRWDGLDSLTVDTPLEAEFAVVGRYASSNDPTRKPLFAQQGTENPSIEMFDLARVDGAGLAGALATGAAELGIDLADPAASFQLYVYLDSSGDLTAAVATGTAEDPQVARPDFVEAGG